MAESKSTTSAPEVKKRNRNWRKFVCENCSKIFWNTGRRNRRFCTQQCYYDQSRGETHSQYKGGHIRKQDGYRQQSINGKWVLEHRLIMEKHLGRPLLDTEVVHHKDHNRLNNAIENLELMESNRAHRLHHGGLRTETEKQCSSCQEIKPRSEFYRLQNPGTRDHHHARCKECMRRDRREYAAKQRQF